MILSATTTRFRPSILRSRITSLSLTSTFGRAHRHRYHSVLALASAPTAPILSFSSSGHHYQVPSVKTQLVNKERGLRRNSTESALARGNYESGGYNNHIISSPLILLDSSTSTPAGALLLLSKLDCLRHQGQTISSSPSYSYFTSSSSSFARANVIMSRNISNDGISPIPVSSPLSQNSPSNLRFPPSSQRRSISTKTPAAPSTATIRSLHNTSPLPHEHKDHHDHEGHSHSIFGHHHHKVDAHGADLLVLANKNDAGVRITRIGLAVNLSMAISKGLGGYFFHSHALTADAVHSLTDLVSDVMTLATISLALKPPTKAFPNGFGKFETLGSLGVSSILLLGGALMGWSAIVDLCHLYLPAVAEFCEQIGLVGHSHSHHHGIPNIQAAWLAGGSIIIKEWLYRATMKIAKEKQSRVLESNAVHHRVDSMTAIAALVSIAASNLFPALHGIDALGSLLITYLVVRTGWGNTKAALTELADEGLDAGVVSEVTIHAQEAIKHAANQADFLASSGTKVYTNNSEEFTDHSCPSRSDSHASGCTDSTYAELNAMTDAQVINVKGVKAGQNFMVDVAIEVPDEWSLERCYLVESAIRQKVCDNMSGIRRVTCRFLTARMVSMEKGMQDGFSDQFRLRQPLKAKDD